MIIENKTIAATPPGADTRDIISALQTALIPAVKQYKENFKTLDATNPHQAAKNTALFIQKNIKYHADGFDFQKIKLPGRLFKDKKGDCKSFSLFIAAALTAANIKNGLRFASYKKNMVPTHVYNWYDVNGQKFFIDSCVKSLNESKNYTFVKDMQVQYLSGLPILTDESQAIGRRRTRSQRREERQQRRDNRRAGKGKPSPVKKVALAPARGPFLALVALNFRGIASKLDRLQKQKPQVVNAFWLRLGGDPKKLSNSINTGKAKKPLLGSRINGATDVVYISEAVTASSLLVAAGGILAALQSLFKKEGIPTEDLAPEGTTPLDKAGTGFNVTDAETPEASTANQSAVQRAEKRQNNTSEGSEISPIILIGGAAALFFILNSKSKK